MAISDTKLRGLQGKPYDGPSEITDADGLGIRITPNGVISFQYRYRFDGKQHRLGIGRYPAISLREARLKVGEYRELLDHGRDPAKFKPTVNVRRTLSDCLKYWWDNYVLISLRKSTAEVYERIVLNEMEGVFEGIPVEDIKISEWVEFFTQHEQINPVKARKLLVHLRGALDWCVRRQYIDSASLIRLSPKDVGKKPKTGETVLTYRQLALIWIAVENSTATESSKRLVKCLMLYGARNSELREALKPEFNFDENIWTLPSTKSKTDKIIRRPIFDKVEALLRGDPHIKSDALFPGAYDRDKPLTIGSATRYIRIIRDQVKIGNFTAHDFRRTLATRLSEEGVAPHVIEKMLGHDLGGVLAVYNKHDWMAEQKAAYEIYAERIFSEIRKISD